MKNIKDNGVEIYFGTVELKPNKKEWKRKNKLDSFVKLWTEEVHKFSKWKWVRWIHKFRKEQIMNDYYFNDVFKIIHLAFPKQTASKGNTIETQQKLFKKIHREDVC